MGDQTPPGVYDDLRLPAPKDPARPYVLVNMVSSVNGVASVGGKAAGIGKSADRKAMRGLRSVVDAVMVGAGTLRAERMRLGLDDPSLPQPLAVILCGPEPPTIGERLIRDPAQRVLLAFPKEASGAYEHPTKGIDLMPTPSLPDGRVDLRAALRKLRTDHGVARLLVEGGPKTNGALLAQGLVDELFVTISPLLLPTTGGHIVDVGAGASRELRLHSTKTSGDEIFLRYTVPGGQPGP
ncbi:hypothetical protein GBA63_10345 [Rubrobacter tropicus]|uniref:Bacterial bifunctional deaminase-reductase C-terminal domain-containing protein n=1 Tax=Rubrobacter tropicus TaxID=2653851 RepID=A0A6G8Q939_9ACTN|nr:RibD family protein [Rubrobacter tropicus]QIN83004.1 hypothetical protein GBA63_10345 [Rubrobacter tropicus]